MYRIAIATACFLAGCSSVGTSGPEERLALARRLLEVQYSPDFMAARGQAYADEYIRRLPDYTDDCEVVADEERCNIAAIDMTAEIKRVLNGSTADIVQLRTTLIHQLAVLYSESYTSEELRAAVAFMESPAGRSMEAKAPLLMRQASELEYRLLRPWTDSIDVKVEEIIYRFGSFVVAPSVEE